MNVLVACECSGVVRDAFMAKGHNAWSCDLQPADDGGLFHFTGCAIDALKAEKWDLIIAHPPCTYFANSGLHYLKTKPGRKKQLEDAFIFLQEIWNSDCSRIAIENPTGWLNTNWKKPTQIIQPYMFGHKELKTTCLWLKGLDPLVESNNVGKPEPIGYVIRKTGRNAGKKYNYYWRQGKNAKQRSKTFQGIADAMADQWG